MQPHDALGPTAPQHAHATDAVRHVALTPPPGRSSSKPRGLAIVGALVAGLVIGILIGRAAPTTTNVIAPPATALGHLGASSKPVDGNVVVDGRFVGVAPIDRLDLDPGKHSVVIDAFGYQPYAGTVDIELTGKLNLSVTLAPLGGEAPTIGTVTGAGVARHAVVPPSALLPAGGAPRAPDGNTASAKLPPQRSSAPVAPARRAPPRRDCGGEQSQCRESCRRASSDCGFACPGCTSCLTSVGWDECKRQCDTCRSGCDQNTRFCESSCDNQHNTCEASQP